MARRRAPTPAQAQTRRGVPAAPDASTARAPAGKRLEMLRVALGHATSPPRRSWRLTLRCRPSARGSARPTRERSCQRPTATLPDADRVGRSELRSRPPIGPSRRAARPPRLLRARLCCRVSGLGRSDLPGHPPAIDSRTAREIDEAEAGPHAGSAARPAPSPAARVWRRRFSSSASCRRSPSQRRCVRVARERDCCAVLVGEHAHGRLGEVFLGVVSRDVIRYAPCPVIVIRQGASPPAPRGPLVTARSER